MEAVERDLLGKARAAQARWVRIPMRERMSVFRRTRALLAEHARELAQTVERSEEALISQVLPLADACQFLMENAPRLLRARRLGAKSRPGWLFGVETTILREPFGVVLVIAPANYPLLLPGVQVLQALAAGNAVLLKPAPGGAPAARALVRLLERAGLDAALVGVLSDSAEAGATAVGWAIDKVIFTGSFGVGVQVLEALAGRAIPAIAELSGCDAVVVRGDADLAMVVKALHFGLRWNGGATCIAPRRVYVARRLAERLEAELECSPAAELSLVAVDSDEEAVALANAGPFALGASVFSADLPAARRVAEQLRAGVVTINDLIVPTADPRIPFGGRGQSGFGVTRGAEGLLELTAPKVIQHRRGKARPHFEPPQPGDAALFEQWISVAHGRGFWRRASALFRFLRAARRRAPASKL